MKIALTACLAFLLAGCGSGTSSKPVATSTPAPTPVQDAKASVPTLEDPGINARVLLRDDDGASEWVPKDDPRVAPLATRIADITHRTGESASAVMLAVGGAASRYNVTRQKLTADVGDAIAAGKLKVDKGMLGPAVLEFAMSHYKKR